MQSTAADMPLQSLCVCEVQEASGRTLCQETGDNLEVRLKLGDLCMVSGEPGLMLQLGHMCQDGGGTGILNSIRIEVMQTLDATPESPTSLDAVPKAIKAIGYTELPIRGLAGLLQLGSGSSWEGVVTLHGLSDELSTSHQLPIKAPFEQVCGFPKVKLRILFSKTKSSAEEPAKDEFIPAPVEFVSAVIEDDDEFIPAPVQSVSIKPKTSETSNELAETLCRKLQARSEVLAQSMNETSLPGCPRCTQRLSFTTEYPEHYPPGGVRCHLCGHTVAIYGGFFLCTAGSMCRFDMCWECYERQQQTVVAPLLTGKVCPQGHALEIANNDPNIREAATANPGEHIVTQSRYLCDKCGLEIKTDFSSYSCRTCNYDMCQSCYVASALGGLGLGCRSNSGSGASLTPLPFPRGSSQYQGFLQHPSMSSCGPVNVALKISRQTGPADFEGQWTAMGQMEDIDIKITGENALIIYNTQGTQTTLLNGVVDLTLGIMAGSLTQDNDGRGTFELHPVPSS